MDLSAKAHRRFFVHEDGREMFEQRLDQYAVSVREVTPEIIQEHGDLYAEWKESMGMVSVKRDAIDGLNAEIQKLKAKIADLQKQLEAKGEQERTEVANKRGPGRPRKEAA